MSGYAKISGNTDWNTPTKYVNAIVDFWDEINLDPCSNEGSIVPAKVKYDINIDGLKAQWSNKTFVNPPYGRGIKDWFAKAWYEHKLNDKEILMLVPVSTNTSHWKEYVWGKANSICFLYDTRLKFRINGDENNKGCPMSCCFVYYGNEVAKFIEIFSNYGYCVKVKI